MMPLQTLFYLVWQTHRCCPRIAVHHGFLGNTAGIDIRHQVDGNQFLERIPACQNSELVVVVGCGEQLRHIRLNTGHNLWCERLCREGFVYVYPDGLLFRLDNDILYLYLFVAGVGVSGIVVKV